MDIEFPQQIRFKCTRCGQCCGDAKQRTRHVLLLEEEAKQIAEVSKLLISEFAVPVAGKLPYRFEMKKSVEHGKCFFMKEHKCTIYSIRPLICRFYPFGFTTNRKLQKIIYFTKECPGIGKGKVMEEADFQSLLKQIKGLGC
jgi:Fe-S-cluster containining protein